MFQTMGEDKGILRNLLPGGVFLVDNQPSQTLDNLEYWELLLAGTITNSRDLQGLMNQGDMGLKGAAVAIVNKYLGPFPTGETSRFIQALREGNDSVYIIGRSSVYRFGREVPIDIDVPISAGPVPLLRALCNYAGELLMNSN